MSNKVYDIVTERIMERLEAGTVPWRRPWHSYPAMNWVSQKPYRGINQILLEPGEYATWNQVKRAGGRVKKGAKSELVTFWKLLKYTGERDGEMEVRQVPFLRYYRVFNIEDCEGLESKQKMVKHQHSPIERAERIAKGYPDGPRITHRPGRAFYRPADDTISIPPLEDHDQPEEYYSTLYHEMVHSTGHPTRLGRLEASNIAAHGGHCYSKEELVAEIGSAMLCSVAGIGLGVIDNQAAYIQAWLERLQNDRRLIVQASSQAQAAADYIMGVSREP